MTHSGGPVALITGASSGIGMDIARQLAIADTYGRIYLACRNRQKAELAKVSLERSTRKNTFEIVEMDLSSPRSVRMALSTIDHTIDDLFMNAGGIGGRDPLALTDDGVTRIFACNVLGHVVLLDSLLAAGRLRRGAVLAGSEAARGVPMLGMGAPKLKESSVEEFASLCNGDYFRERRPDPITAYAHVKYVGAMWLSAEARKWPDLKLLTVSPGNTRNTAVMTDFPAPVRLVMKYLFTPVIAPALRMVHDVDRGAKRMIDALSQPAFKTGHFYASGKHALTGPLVDQSDILADLANESFQDNANEAVHRFL
ncbi:SDR family NAD(P)-dependent oxidoreductase [Burkholderia cenocepacia]|uniref:SDR family NAD(P)-dependent oxidoreductase n=1 Tax=Burkholderia cenocepacia TaxID=95486 RepID=UPI00285593F1|nr:SDR family NAD(P)-dependent oxidoreductase [Burkholderia cenocepacia]MDR5644422.1 SDR family NAD(P)-dependent oxidoreductase [Burkholderia cenocepacia]